RSAGLHSTAGLEITAGGMSNLTSGTSTRLQAIDATLLNITSTSATSTFANGIQLSGGCFKDTSGFCDLTSGGFLITNITNKFLGIGTTTPGSHLSVAGNTYLDSNLLTLGSSSAATLTIAYQRTSTSTIPDLTLNAWSIGTTTTNIPILSISTFAGTGVASTTATGRIGLGTTTPEARLSIDGTTAANLGVAGIHEIISATSTTGGTQFANRFIAYNLPKHRTNTFVSEFIRIIDDSGLANTVRGIEVQSGSGTTTAGVNTGLRSTGKTFGVQGITTATGAGDLIPAGVYAESTSSTTGQALRVYTGTTTTADLAVFYQEGTQKFQGTGLKMNFGAGAGAFEGAFLNLQ
ncbi:MAG: hypothetical protein AAB968_03470, partial [Patescibacteria group bacterium]